MAEIQIVSLPPSSVDYDYTNLLGTKLRSPFCFLLRKVQHTLIHYQSKLLATVKKQVSCMNLFNINECRGALKLSTNIFLVILYTFLTLMFIYCRF